jgi:hypothetical protein
MSKPAKRTTTHHRRTLANPTDWVLTITLKRGGVGGFMVREIQPLAHNIILNSMCCLPHDARVALEYDIEPATRAAGPRQRCPAPAR